MADEDELGDLPDLVSLSDEDDDEEEEYIWNGKLNN